jgi:hypothetical protein
MVGIPRGECNAVQLRAQPKQPGILDAETKCQKSSFKRANARKDENLRVEWPEIPAKTPYLASCRKRAVCKGWVVADAVEKNRSLRPNSLLTGKLTGNLLVFGSFEQE